MLDEGDAARLSDLELEVGRGVPVEFRRLLGATEHWASIINEITRAYIGTDRGVRWLVEADRGSVRLLLHPEASSDDVRPSAVAQLPEVVAEGIRRLEHEPQRPDYFSDKALEAVKSLASFVKDDFRLSVRNGHDRIEMTSQTVANVDKILGTPRDSIGSIEGRLEAVNVHEGQQFSIWPPGGKGVKCNFGKYIALNEVLPAVGKRVAARGRIRTRPNGTLMWVEVHSLRVIGENPTSASEVRGIFSGREAADA